MQKVRNLRVLSIDLRIKIRTIIIATKDKKTYSIIKQKATKAVHMQTHSIQSAKFVFKTYFTSDASLYHMLPSRYIFDIFGVQNNRDLKLIDCLSFHC